MASFQINHIKGAFRQIYIVLLIVSVKKCTIREFTDVIFFCEGDKKDLLLYFRGASPKSIVSNMKELINVESRISLHTYAVKI